MRKQFDGKIYSVSGYNMSRSSGKGIYLQAKHKLQVLKNVVRLILDD